MLLFTGKEAEDLGPVRASSGPARNLHRAQVRPQPLFLSRQRQRSVLFTIFCEIDLTLNMLLLLLLLLLIPCCCCSTSSVVVVVGPNCSVDLRLAEYDWLIGNHSDELTPWIPVVAGNSSYTVSGRERDRER
jgi:hypothetical protein